MANSNGFSTIADHKTLANGLCYKWGSFRHIAAVALMLDVLAPIDAYKMQLQTREHTCSKHGAQFHAQCFGIRASREQRLFQANRRFPARIFFAGTL
jgi:hypothetical protein